MHSIITLFLVYYAEFLVLFIAKLCVIMPSVIMLSVIMLSVIMQSVIMLSVIMLSVIMLSVIMLSVISGLQELAWPVSNRFYP